MTNTPHPPHQPSSHLPTPAAGTLAVLAAAWLFAVLSSARHTIGADPEASARVLNQAAQALPAVVSASLLAGAAVGLAAVNLLNWRAPAAAGRTGPPYGVGAGAGAVTGLAAATPVAMAYAGLPSILALGIAVAAAATVGGLLAGVRPRIVIAAGVGGGLGVFLVEFVIALFDGDLLDLFGAGDTAESVLAANAWVRLTASMVAGLVAGVLGYVYLRRCGPRTLRWPAYMIAGALPGLLGLLAEALTRLGGSRLFQLVSAAGTDQQAVLSELNAARLNGKLIILFVGALVAIFLVGRTLRPEPDAGTDAGTDAGGGPEPALDQDQARDQEQEQERDPGPDRDRGQAQPSS